MDDERLKFEGMINFIWASKDFKEPRCATVVAATPDMARKMRRRLYYLRDQSTGDLRDRADKMAFRIEKGTIVVVELLPQWQPTFTTGEQTDGNQESASDGDDQAGILPDGTLPKSN